jgi:hypothetical protein
MLAPVKQIIPLTLIQRQRLLPIPGRVIARKGQTVEPTDVIAEALTSPEHILLDISRGLGLEAEEADTYLERVSGEKVDEGDVIAGPVGLSQRVVRAPKSGRIVLAGGGQVLIEVESNLYELKAGFSGVIEELLPDLGAVIETTGALIQGVWGNGRMNYGLMYVLLRSPDDELRPDRLDVSLRGAVVLGGHVEEPGVLTIAEELPLRGLILGSMSSSLVPLANKMRYPIILTDGFGPLPMNENAYKLLSTSQRREVSLRAESWDPVKAAHPEIIIPLPTESGSPIPLDAAEFRPGQLVRVAHALHHGKIGRLDELLTEEVTLPSGITTACAYVSFEGIEEPALLPLVNLEIIGTQ